MSFAKIIGPVENFKTLKNRKNFPKTLFNALKSKVHKKDILIQCMYIVYNIKNWHTIRDPLLFIHSFTLEKLI